MGETPVKYTESYSGPNEEKGPPEFIHVLEFPTIIISEADVKKASQEMEAVKNVKLQRRSINFRGIPCTMYSAFDITKILREAAGSDFSGGVSESLSCKLSRMSKRRRKIAQEKTIKKKLCDCSPSNTTAFQET